MEAEEWPVVVEPSVFCLSWEGDPGKKRVMVEIWGFFSSSFRFRALFQTCPQRGMQLQCPEFGTFKLCFAIGQEGIKFLELGNSLFSLGASQGFSIQAVFGIMERCVRTERRWLGSFLPLMHFQTSAVSQMDHFGFMMFILRAGKLLRCRSPFSPFPQPRELHPCAIPWGFQLGWE